MIVQIKRSSALRRFSKFPRADNYHQKFFFPNASASYTYSLKAKSLKGHIKILAAELTKLTINLGFDSLIFLGDTSTPWLYQDNEYKPVKKALDFLRSNKITKTFNGALMISTSQLKEFFEHIAWLSRCNASLPYFHFMDKKESFVGEICKYCNLHIYPLNNSTDQNLKKSLKKSQFIPLQTDRCYNQYSHSSKIIGRQIIV